MRLKFTGGRFYQMIYSYITLAVIYMTQQFNYAWQNRDKNDYIYDQREVLFDNWNVTEEVTSRDKNNDPGNTPYDVITDKPQIVHLSNTRYKGHKCANNGDEPRQDNRLTAMPFIELMGTL